MNLFKHYHLVVLCERSHPEITQYDLIYEVVSNPQFQKESGRVFMEIGSAAMQPYVESFLMDDQLNGRQINEKLRHIASNMGNDPFWPDSNYYDFLRKVYHLNRSLPKDRRVHVYPVGLNFDWTKATKASWTEFQKEQLKQRDKLMAENIIRKFDEIQNAKTRNRALVIMDYRHAFPHIKGTSGEVHNTYGYLLATFPGKVANVMINSVANLPGTTDEKANFTAIEDGKWDAAFAVLKNPDLGFDFKNSPFGKDDFDYWPFKTGLRYQDVFTGLVFFKPLKEQRFSIGLPGLADKSFKDEVLMRCQNVGLKLSDVEMGIITNMQTLHIYGYDDCPFLSKSDYAEKIRQWLKTGP